jgi:hypothetical protein
MTYQISRLLDDLTRIAGNFDRQQWIMISLLVLVIGLVTMRGFGSRINY